jgi:5-methylthioribose kinase
MMGIESKADYQPLTVESLPHRLGTLPILRDRLGDDIKTWRAREVGDGNLNLVFIVEGATGSAVVKQALPYVRLVGESWPLPLKRAFFEFNALQRQAARAPGLTPEIYHVDEAQAMIVMEYLTPHIILRKGMVAGTIYPRLARDLGVFMAHSLFKGSDLHMSARDRKRDLALFADNIELCDITENLVFSDPYFEAKLNRHTRPHLDAYVGKLRADRDLKVAAQQMKAAFCSHAQTLLHGDLHAGSVMVTAGDTRVIDPEFAVYGPIGFDIGMLLGNFWMAYFAQSGHEKQPGDRDAYRDWILRTVEECWAVFHREFTHLWRHERTGILYERSLFEDQGDTLGSEQALHHYLQAVWADTLGFAGVEMHRRILGLAHVHELESIEDLARRAACEQRALALGRHIAVNRHQITALQDIHDLARRIEQETLS